MTTATNAWHPYNFQSTWLSPGDEVKVQNKKGEQQIGLFKRKLTKNLLVVMDGKEWRVSPSLISEYREGDPDNLPQPQTLPESTVKCNPQGLNDCNAGDVILLWRGKFEVVKVESLFPKFRCRLLDGRGKGNIYIYKPEWFVMKLDNGILA